jgi:hypothetical protein
MKKFSSPQINVVKFMNDDVITTSSGYSGNVTETDFDLLGGLTTQAADQGIDDPVF